jgi:DNA primase
VGGISEEDIERVKSAVNIVDIISRFVPLKKAGKNFVGICPFHPDSSPSFNVSPQRQIFKCFGCGKAGSVFTFLMEYSRVDFPSAVRSLAEECGIEIRTSQRESRGSGDFKRRLFEATDFAASFFQRCLLSPAGQKARSYLKDRGFSEKTWETFGIGFSPVEWSALLDAGSRRRIGAQTFEKAGLAVPRKSGSGHYDRFRGRIIFPIADLQGRILAFGGRLLAGEGPKYINSPETAIYSKGRLLYGLGVARNHNPESEGLVLMEGYTDVIAAHQAGIGGAVASLGTALTKDQALLLRRFTRKVFLLYDPDPAGLAAMERGVELLLQCEIEPRVAELPGGADPADFLGQKGAGALRELLDESPDFFDFKLGLLERKLDLRSHSGKAQAVDEMLGIVRASQNPVVRQLGLRRIADAVGVEESAVARRAEETARPARTPAPAPRPRRPSPQTRIEGDIIEAILCRPNLIDRAREDFPLSRYTDEELRAVAEIAYRLHDLKRPVTLADVLRTPPRGALSEVVSRIARLDSSGEEKDFEKQYREGLRLLDRHTRNDHIRRIKLDLRQAKARGDQSRVDLLLKKLQTLL